MFSLEFDAQPTLQQIQKFILEVERDVLSDLTGFWHQGAQPVVVKEIARVFATQGYGTWAPLSPAYARYKSRRYPGKTILRRKDVYFRAATRKASGNIFEVSKEQMTWGIDLGYFASRFGFPYPVAHERGGRHMPARQVFGLLEGNTGFQNRLVSSLKAYLTKRIKDAARGVRRIRA